MVPLKSMGILPLTTMLPGFYHTSFLTAQYKVIFIDCLPYVGLDLRTQKAYVHINMYVHFLFLPFSRGIYVPNNKASKWSKGRRIETGNSCGRQST